VADVDFGPDRILGVLAAYGVRSILIGGFAAVIHGSPYVTTDVDVVPAADDENLHHLSDALTEMHARVWTAAEPDGLPFDHSAASLVDVGVWNLVTDRPFPGRLSSNCPRYTSRRSSSNRKKSGVQAAW